MNLYLKRLSELNVKPNFFVSRPLLTLFGARPRENDQWLWLEDKEEICLLPPLPKGGHTGGWPVDFVWADFDDFPPPEGERKFLDHEYLFRPADFLTMEGGKWQAFRKNSRKWPRGRKWRMSYTTRPGKALDRLVARWLSKRPNMEGAEALASMVLNPSFGVQRACLYLYSSHLVAVNVWDYNHMFINYRYCICPDEPYLDEFMRLQFYLGMNQIHPGMLVNDGGSVGQPGIEAHKDRMNPFRKREVRSWSLIRP